MSAAPKLTKKQKKSLAFRERKAKPPIANDRKKHKNELTGNDDDALLALEGEDIFGLDGGEAEAEGDAHAEDSAQIGDEEGHALQHKKGKGGGKGKSKKESEDVPVFVADLKGKKRKREGGGEVDEGMRQDKVKKAKQTSPVEEKNDKAKQKFILFVGEIYAAWNFGNLLTNLFSR
jgi:nucleolar protein 6